ncbi:hypothetical protein KUCAC02_035240 [Chaenocephalus aceratus]|nr:hypothetical protein KUCAC02_035240 [Chaenocephalus aceratus]
MYRSPYSPPEINCTSKGIVSSKITALFILIVTLPGFLTSSISDLTIGRYTQLSKMFYLTEFHVLHTAEMSLWFSLAGSIRRMAWEQIAGPDGRSSCRGRDEGRPDLLDHHAGSEKGKRESYEDEEPLWRAKVVAGPPRHTGPCGWKLGASQILQNEAESSSMEQGNRGLPHLGRRNRRC